MMRDAEQMPGPDDTAVGDAGDAPGAGRDRGWRGSADLWLQGAQALLAEGGVEAVKIGPLSARLGLSRTSFYWHFPDREALLAALVAHWRAHSTAALVGRTRAPAATITEAVLNLFDAWVDRGLFDSRVEFAMRTWALTDPAVSRALAEEDAQRIAALAGMFQRFGYPGAEADTRARTVYLTQVGYIAMRAEEDFETRMTRIPAYALTFAGIAPSQAEVAAFRDRHSGPSAGARPA
jgi:AcrR family transcriptional regulator